MKASQETCLRRKLCFHLRGKGAGSALMSAITLASRQGY